MHVLKQGVIIQPGHHDLRQGVIIQPIHHVLRQGVIIQPGQCLEARGDHTAWTMSRGKG